MSEDPEKNQMKPSDDSDSPEAKGSDGSNLSPKDENLAETPSSSPESNVAPEASQSEPQKAETWEEQLQKPINSEEAAAMKNKKKEESKKKRIARQKQLETLTTEVVEKEFSKLFDKRTSFYFVFFLIGTIAIGLLTLLKGDEPSTGIVMQWWQITIALTMIFGFLFMLLFSTNKSIHNLLFHESKVTYKIIFMVLSLFLSFILVFLYWYLTGSALSVPPDGNYIGPDQLIKFGDLIFGIESEAPLGNVVEIEALRYQAIFGTLFAVIFFGWNVIQIWFIKNGLEVNCIRIEARFQVAVEDLPTKNRVFRTGIINFLTVLAPFIFHVVFTWIFLYVDTPTAWTWFYDVSNQPVPENIQTFVTERLGKITGLDFYFADFKVNHAADIVNMTKESEIFGLYFMTVWWSDGPLRLILIWFIITLIILTITAINQKNLFRMSYENKSPNIFSGFFYLFFWIIVWLKLFMIIKTAITLNENVQVSLQWYDMLLDYLVDLFLMLFTIFMVLRGFGKKIRGLKKSWITDYNTVFLMFLFVLSYFSGQMTIITGGLVGSPKQLSITSNIIVVIVNLIFYFWYSRWVLERKGFIRKSSFTAMETRGLLVDLSQDIKGNLLQTIENEEIIMSTLNKFMLDKHIVLETPAKGEEGVVSNLKEEDLHKTSEMRLGRAQDAYKIARTDLDNYEAAIKQLEDSKIKLTQLKTQETSLQKEIATLPATLEDDLAKAKNKHSDAVNQLRQCQEDIVRIRQEIKEFDASRTGTTAEFTAEQKAKKDKLDFQLTQLVPDEFKYQNAIQTAQTAVDAAQIKVDQANAKKAELVTLQSEIEKTEKEIAALEINIKILKDRADESQPSLDAATVALESAKIELESFNALEKAKLDQKDGQQKFALAQEKSGYASNQLKAAEERIAATKTIEQAKVDIKTAQNSIVEQQKKLEELRNDLGEKQGIMTEKNSILTTAQALLQEKQTIKSQNDQKITEIQAKLNRDKESLKTGQGLLADLEHAKQVLKDAQASQKKIDTVEKADQNLKTAQTREKDAKVQLKETKKQHETEPGTPLAVQEKVKAVDDAEEAVRTAKDRLREAKEVQINIDSAQKHVTTLEAQQLNLDQIRTDIANDETALKEAMKSAEIPQKEFQDADVACQNASAEFGDAKKQVEASQLVVTSGEVELHARENNKAAAERALADRQEAEKSLAVAKDTFSKGEDLLSKATNNLNEKKNSQENAEKNYEERIEDAKADWNIAVCHVELRQAHKTFKDAIRSAEANLKARESRLADSIAAKETLLKNREVLTNPTE